MNICKSALSAMIASDPAFFWSLLNMMLQHLGNWKCGSLKCDTRKNARVENAGVLSSLAVWKAEPRLYW